MTTTNVICKDCGHNRHYHQSGAGSCIIDYPTDKRIGAHDLNANYVPLVDNTGLTGWDDDGRTNPHILAYFKFNSSLLDSVCGHTLVLQAGSTLYTTGIFGDANGALDLNGLTWFALTSILEKAKFDFNWGAQFSVSFWYKSSTAATSKFFVGNSASATTIGWRIFVNASDNTVAEISDGVTDWFNSLASNVVNGSWHHIVVVFTNNGTLHTVYVDNTKDTVGTTGGFNSLATGLGLSVGAETDGGSLNTGNLDELIIFDRALTDAEVAILYNSGTGFALV